MNDQPLTIDEQRVAIERYRADLPLTVEQAAWVLSISPRTLVNVAADGKIGYVKALTRCSPMFLREHLVEYLSDRRVERTVRV